MTERTGRTEQAERWKRTRRRLVLLTAAAVLAVGGLVGVGMCAVSGALEDSDVYAFALEQVRRSPAAVEALGAPIHGGTVMTGRIERDDAGSQARMTFRVEGSKDEGKVKFFARLRPNGLWELSRLELEPDRGGGPIDLLAAQAPPR